MRGWIYYVGTLGWGFGWLPLAAAVGGAVAALRRDWRRALLLIAFPLFLYLFLGAQGRFFGRWMLPAYPMLCVLCGLRRRRARRRAGARARAAPARAVVGLAALVCAQGAIASVRVDALLGREDTRAQALRLDPRERARGRAARRRAVRARAAGGGARPPALARSSARSRRTRSACACATSTATASAGTAGSWSASTQKERGLKAGLRSSRNYYRALDAESARTVTFSPFARRRRAGRVLLRLLVQLPPARLRAARPGGRDPPAARMSVTGAT